MIDLKKYGNSVIARLFTILDLTKASITDEDNENITKFIDNTLVVEIEGSLDYFSEVKYGNQMTSVLMKVKGIRTVTDFNVRKKVIFDSIGIINKIIKEL